MASQALLAFDQSFWVKQSARWLDIVGDYAGQELFVLDGDALIQYVLDNPLLALGRLPASTTSFNSTENRPEPPTFQLLHAVWLLETTLKKLLERNCVFDIVFWESQRANTILTGSSPYVTSSRSLARSLLILHIHKLFPPRASSSSSPSCSTQEVGQKTNGGTTKTDVESLMKDVEVFEFEGLDDAAWREYHERKRPMFLMSHDGGLPGNVGGEGLVYERILTQRLHLYQVMKQEIAVVLLQPAEFKDGKILSYVYDRTRRHQRRDIDPSILLAGEDAQLVLSVAASSLAAPPAAPQNGSSGMHDLTSIITRSLRNYLTSSPTPSGNDRAVAYLFMAHMLVLPSIPLPHRAQKPPVYLSQPLLEYLQQTLPGLYSAIEQALPARWEDGILDIDGTVFVLLVGEVLMGKDLGDLLGKDLVLELDGITLSAGLGDVGLEGFRNTFPQSAKKPRTTTMAVKSHPTLLPFSTPLFDKLLSSVHVRTSPNAQTDLPSYLDHDTVFADTTHWHSSKALAPEHEVGGGRQSTLGLPAWLIERYRKNRLRREQKFMASMQRSAESLTGVKGGGLVKRVVPLVGVSVRELTEEGKVGVKKVERVGSHQKVEKKGKEKGLNKVEQMKADIAAKRSGVAADSNKIWWNQNLAELNAITKIDSKIESLEYLFANKRVTTDTWLFMEVTLKRLDLELRRWVDLEGSTDVSSDTRDAFRVFLARTANELFFKHDKGQIRLSASQTKPLVTMLRAVGLDCLVPATLLDLIDGSHAEKATETPAKGKAGKGKESKAKSSKSVTSPEPSREEDLTFDFISLFKKSGSRKHKFMTIKEDPVEFQLRCMGDYMIRSLDSKPDSRVGFEPDAWQIEVLDKIDRDESMLIVAPTSSGKTFISFAAMERVLRESDDGIVIYVAPTKALVNQVAAEVYARFQKQIPGLNLFSIYTRDYRLNDPAKCQILVTVPHILSMLLLSPYHAAKWAPRIRRVIVDEIHSIAEDEGGAIWETVLLTNPAPLIGLSATVGNPERFSGWLESVERSKGKEYSMILHELDTTRSESSSMLPRILSYRLQGIRALNLIPSGLWQYIHWLRWL